MVSWCLFSFFRFFFCKLCSFSFRQHRGERNKGEDIGWRERERERELKRFQRDDHHLY